MSWFQNWGARVACAWSTVQRSQAWPLVRNRFIHGKTCAACTRRTGLEAHHVKPFHLHPDRELDPENLIALCRSCHLMVGHLGDWPAYNPDVVADASAWAAKVTARPYD